MSLACLRKKSLLALSFPVARAELVCAFEIASSFSPLENSAVAIDPEPFPDSWKDVSAGVEEEFSSGSGSVCPMNVLVIWQFHPTGRACSSRLRSAAFCRLLIG